MTYDTLASEELIAQTKSALEEHGFTVHIAENGAEAKEKALSLIPKGAEVMTQTSVTNTTIGLTQELDESGSYDSVRVKLNAMNNETQAREKRKLGAAPDYVVGSVHAVAATGEVFIASNTGSQLPSYVYGAEKVIWVVGAQKIVPTVDEAINRIHEYVLPLESERANKAYNITSGSFISKLLRINKEVNPGRLTLIIVKEKLGF